MLMDPGRLTRRRSAVSDGQRRILLWAGAVVTLWLSVGLCVRGMHEQWSRRAPIALPLRIDLNKARMAELMLLEGIGRTRAEQIVLHRVRYGPFSAPEDLLTVDGLGPKTVQGVTPFVCCGS